MPHEALLCRDLNCKRHLNVINEYYESIVIVLSLSHAAHCIPTSKRDFHKHWWSPELDELKTMCIEATELWRSHGCPRSGLINTNRLQCKYQYKIAIKAAIADSQLSFNDEMADHLNDKDDVRFWKTWRKRYCSRSVKMTMF